MTTTIQPGAVVSFLMSNQNVKTPFKIDWMKVKGSSLEDEVFGMRFVNLMI